MKKLTLLLALMLLTLVTSFAASPSDFAVNEQELNLQMADLNKAEAFVTANPNATVKEVEGVATDLKLTSDFAQSLGAEPPFGVPSFVWGLVLGVIGIVLVYVLTDSDKAESKKALMGCIVAGAAVALIYIFVFVISLAGTATL